MSEENVEVAEEVVTETVDESVTETTTPEIVTEEKSEPVDDKSFVDKMIEGLEDKDLKSHKMWDNLKGKDANELAKYVKELKSFTGKKGDIPAEDATKEEWDAFYGKLGRPVDAEGYDLNLSDEFKELVGEATPWFEDAVVKFKDMALDANLSPEKADKMLGEYLDLVATQTQEGQKLLTDQAEAADKELRTEFGDEYDGMMKGNKAMLKNLGGLDDAQIKAMEDGGLLKDPSLAIALGKIASNFDDNPLIGHHQTNTMAGLKDQLAETEHQVKEYLMKGESLPSHLSTKLQDLRDKVYTN